MHTHCRSNVLNNAHYHLVVERKQESVSKGVLNMLHVSAHNAHFLTEKQLSNKNKNKKNTRLYITSLQ